MRDWFELTLKEGLTVYRDQEFSSEMRSPSEQRVRQALGAIASQFPEDAGPLRHSPRPASYERIDNFYTATVYEKGAEVIGMLKTLVGPEGYRKATDLYFERHDGQAATVEDWVKCFEDACGRDLSQFRLWYRQAGTPVIEAEGHYDAAAKTYALTLRQSLSPTPGQPVKKPMQIPVRLGLIGNGGAALPLTLEGENAPGPEDRVLELTAAEQQFVFTGVAEEPLVSLGRHFSAPAIFKTPTSRAGRAALMAHDCDAFNRWEAGQTLATEILLDLTEAAKSGGALNADATYLDAIGNVLKDAESDMAFAALMMMPPLESQIAMAKAPADPDAIHAARTALIRATAIAHGAKLKALYEKLASPGAYSPDAASAGRRALRNASLRYLTAADDEAAAELAERHYRSATNMTDMIAGLAALTRMISPRRDAALADFHDRFRKDPLVLDKWLGLQAGAPAAETIERVRALMAHTAFDLKNPNRVRALVGAFSGNHLRFHAADGAGYRLVAETVKALDGINPQIAARLAGAFENWRRYDARRQGLMRGHLEAIAGMKGLSTNLFEVATKMLG